MKKVAIFGAEVRVEEVYPRFIRNKLAAMADLYGQIVTKDALGEHLGRLADVEAVFGTWGMPPLKPEQVAAMPRLRAVFYGAGSVHAFAAPLLEREILLVSAWKANATPVAQYTMAQVLLAAKGYFHNIRDCRIFREDRAKVFVGDGLFAGMPLAVLGAGAVGREVIRLLKPFNIDIVVFDPFMTGQQAAELGVRKIATLEEAFSQCCIVSNHLADKPQTVGMINGALLSKLPPKATFINTGRGATVVEADLAAVMKARPDLTALLDVTEPEPALAGNPLYDLPNVYISNHIAGALNKERSGLGQFMVDQFANWQAGRPIDGQVRKEMLATLA